jgi:hypothetical protein
VPIDGSSLYFADRSQRKDLGPVGPRSAGGQGIHVMTALALASNGTPLGVLDQHYWTRPQQAPVRGRRRNCGSKQDRRPRDQRESFIWVESLRRVHANMAQCAPGTTPWFQMDRGADCMSVLIEAADAGLRVTVRAVYDRCLRWADGHQTRLLLSLALQPIIGTYEVDVPARGGQVERRAAMALRVAQMPLLLCIGRKRRRVLPVTVVLATEQNPPPGQIPLRWMLFTTVDVRGVVDAVDVVAAYALRWRIEDFHKTWKSGACNIESSKLQTKAAILRWATIMASVAARIEHIKHVARCTPDVPATTAYSRDEIDAAILLYKSGATKIRVRYVPGDTPTVAEVTHWIASLGGHMGNPRTRPPGATVIRRGLDMVTAAAATLAAMRREQM